MNILPFTPKAAGTVNLSVSGTTGNVALSRTGPTGNYNGEQIMVTSAPSGAIAFIEFGTSSSVTAVAATGTPILPGAIMMFTVASDTTYVAAIGSAGTLYFTAGMGS
jgi:hypothetical protein